MALEPLGSKEDGNFPTGKAQNECSFVWGFKACKKNMLGSHLKRCKYFCCINENIKNLQFLRFFDIFALKFLNDLNIRDNKSRDEVKNFFSFFFMKEILQSLHLRENPNCEISDPSTMSPVTCYNGAIRKK